MLSRRNPGSQPMSGCVLEPRVFSEGPREGVGPTTVQCTSTSGNGFRSRRKRSDAADDPVTAATEFPQHGSRPSSSDLLHQRAYTIRLSFQALALLKPTAERAPRRLYEDEEHAHLFPEQLQYSENNMIRKIVRRLLRGDLHPRTSSRTATSSSRTCCLRTPRTRNRFTSAMSI
jgi:hypothetical protein